MLLLCPCPTHPHQALRDRRRHGQGPTCTQGGGFCEGGLQGGPDALGGQLPHA